MWSKKEETILIENYEKSSFYELKQLLPDKTISAIKNRAFILNLKKCKTKREKNNHPNKWSDNEISILRVVYNKTKDELLESLPNRKYNNILFKIRDLNLNRDYDSSIWSNEEINILNKTYSNSITKDIIHLFNNKTIKQVQSKATKLGLTKDVSFLKSKRSEILIKRNKELGRDLSYNNLKEIALQYNTRCVFQQYDASAYKTARIKGWLEQICQHMLPQKNNIPQIIDYDNTKNLCDSYANYNIWKKENFKLYSKLQKCNRIHEFTAHMKRKKVIWSVDKAYKEISKYRTLKDFYNESKGCYLYCKRNNIELNLIDGRRRKNK
jgi:hypothetical protein